MRQPIETTGAAAAVGPYSQAVRAGEWIWVSGQIGLDPATGALVPGGVEAETERALANLRAILDAAGSGFDRVVRATIYLTDMGDFPVVNRIYGAVFGDVPPARACVEVSGLPKGACVEIDAVALS